MWNLRNKTNEQEKKERKRVTNQNRLLTIKNTPIVTRREMGGEMCETGQGD